MTVLAIVTYVCWCKRLQYSIQKKRTRLNKDQLTRIYFSPNKKKRLNILERFTNLYFFNYENIIKC